MTNLNILEKLRTRKEVEDYFKQLGKNITEEELNALKQSYEKAQESSGALTMQQLDDVAGGILFICDSRGTFFSPFCDVKINKEGKLVLISSGAHGEELPDGATFFNIENPIQTITVKGMRDGEKFGGEIYERTSSININKLFDFTDLRSQLNTNRILESIEVFNERSHNHSNMIQIYFPEDLHDETHVENPIEMQRDGTYKIVSNANIEFNAPESVNGMTPNIVEAINRSLSELILQGAGSPGHEFNGTYLELIKIIDACGPDYF